MRVPMLDVFFFRNRRFSAASAAVTITFFSLMGFIFVIGLYFQFLKGYGPLSTGVRLLPVATMVSITSVLGTRIAVRSGTKLVVASACSRWRRGSPGPRRERTSTGYRLDRRFDDLHRLGDRPDERRATESIMGAVRRQRPAWGPRSTTRPDARRHPRGRRDGSVYASSTRATSQSASSGLARLGRGQRTPIRRYRARRRRPARRPRSTRRGPRPSRRRHISILRWLPDRVLVAAGVALGGMMVALALIPNQPPTASIKQADFSFRVSGQAQTRPGSHR